MTGALAVLQEFAHMPPVVPPMFIAHLFFKAWLDYRVQVRSLPTQPAAEPSQPVRGADVVQTTPPAPQVDEDTPS